MKTLLYIASVSVVTAAFSASSLAQRPPRGGGANQGGQPPGARGGFRNANQVNQNAADFNAAQLGRNQNLGNANDNQAAGQQIPSIEQLSQMMIANFDADGSGGLESAELQNALVALRQMMQSQNRMRGQNGMGGDQQGEAVAGQVQRRRRGENQRVEGAGANNRARGLRGGRNDRN